MKVDIVYRRTSDSQLFVVLRNGIIIGKVMHLPECDQWFFKHNVVDHLLFIGDTREDAVSIYYKNFGGMSNGRMECVRFSEQCNI